MEKEKIEAYKRELQEIENMLTDDMIKQLSKEEIQEYIVLVTKIKARLEILESLE